MHSLLLAFVAVALATAALDLTLRRRQSRHVAAHRATVPPGFEASVTLPEHQRAADYEQARLRLGAVSTLYGLALALAWAFFGYRLLYAAVATQLQPGLLRSLAVLLALGAASFLLALPLQLISTFGIEQRFGFNRTTPARFALDKAKSALLSALLAIPLLAGLLWLMARPGLWWLWAWLGLMLLMLVLMDVFPRWIAPLFNTFTPLEGPLRARIEALLHRCGFQAAGLFVMDASRRSAKGNAYFTGLGRSKRIVLFDTLVAQNSEPELEAVLAHELGHFKLNHVLLGLAQTALVTLLGFFAIGWLSHQPWLLPSFGLPSFGLPAQDPALVLVVGLLVVETTSPLTALLSNWISRRHEYQADDFARRMVGAPPLVAALTRLSRDNASTLTPDPLYALVNFSHPPVPLRVERLLNPA